MKLKPFTRGVLRLWIVLTFILFVYTYYKGASSREAWPRMWFRDTVAPAKVAILNPACQPLLLNPQLTDLGPNSLECMYLQSVLTTSENLKELAAKGVKITPQDIQNDYDTDYKWYAAKGGLYDAAASIFTSVFLLGFFLIVVKVAKWVFVGFRKETS